MNEEKVLITNEIKKIYSIILSIFTAILILFSILTISTFCCFLHYITYLPNYESGISIHNIVYETGMLLFASILSFFVLISILPFEILSKNKKVNIIVYLVTIVVYLGILGSISLYLITWGINAKTTLL